MAIGRKVIFRELKEMLIIGVFGGLVSAYVSCRSCFGEFNSRTVAVLLLNGSFWIFFWKGNQYLSELIGSRISWLEAPAKRFWVGLVVMIAYTCFAAVVIYYVFFIVYLGRTVSELLSSVSVFNLIIPVFITMLIMTFLFGREFLINYRQAAINLEKLRSEQLASQYETLKSQVNPHFLFNSLNVLTSLVHQQPDTAVKFIKKLSEVYRFVLDSRKQEVVTLETELKFVKDYLYLQKIRFGDSLACEMQVPEEAMNKLVPPLSIQMLVENAIKHNEISVDYPLMITIAASEDQLTVSNNVREKRNSEPSSGFGLDNIRDRYEFLSGRKVGIIKNDERFEVCLPLLSLQGNESVAG